MIKLCNKVNAILIKQINLQRNIKKKLLVNAIIIIKSQCDTNNKNFKNNLS